MLCHTLRPARLFAPCCVLPRHESQAIRGKTKNTIYTLAAAGAARPNSYDPAAGSPTATLLRLLLALRRILQTQRGCIFKIRRVANSDGRCVQRAGTESARAVDTSLLGIPRSGPPLHGPIPSTTDFATPPLGGIGLRLPLYHACRPERLRASQTCYCLEPPAAHTARHTTPAQPQVGARLVCGIQGLVRYRN